MDFKSGDLMKRTIPNKIHIIGSVGSGKTTLARNLSMQFHIPHVELDQVVWVRHAGGDIKRTEKERDKLLSKIVRSDAWIIEGAHFHQWVFPSLYDADLIIFLDIAYSKRQYRIIKRFILQKMGMETANYTPTFSILKSMFRWNADFESKVRPKLLKMLNQSPYKDKALIFRDDIEMKKYFSL